jgi:hypothetical protein
LNWPLEPCYSIWFTAECGYEQSFSTASLAIMTSALLIVFAAFLLYQLAMRRKPQADGDRHFGNGLLFWPYIRRRLHAHPTLKAQPFLLGFASGALLGATFLLNIAVGLLAIFAIAFVFGEHQQTGALLFALLFLGLPWVKFLSTPFSNPLLLSAIGFAINVGLLSVGWGLRLAFSSKAKGRK